jgi:hypothetical protein
MSDWDPFRKEVRELTYEERKAEWEKEHEGESIGGKADGGAGGDLDVFATPQTMNDLLRDAIRTHVRTR